MQLRWEQERREQELRKEQEARLQEAREQLIRMKQRRAEAEAEAEAWRSPRSGHRRCPSPRSHFNGSASSQSSQVVHRLEIIKK